MPQWKEIREEICLTKYKVCARNNSSISVCVDCILNDVSLQIIAIKLFWNQALAISCSSGRLQKLLVNQRYLNSSSRRTFYVSVNSLFREVLSIILLGRHHCECAELIMYVEVRFTRTSYNEEYLGLEIINGNFTLNFHLFLLVIPLFTNAVNSIRT